MGPVNIQATLTNANLVASLIAVVTAPNKTTQTVSLTQNSSTTYVGTYAAPLNTGTTPAQYSVQVGAQDQSGAIITSVPVTFQVPVQPGSWTTTADGLQYADTKVGTGAVAASGNTVNVTYTGTLDNGTVFDSSLNPASPFQFTIGQGQVIAGWDEGVQGMKVGGIRDLTIPPALGYAGQVQTSSSGVSIPANSTLHFEITLVSISS